MAEFDAAKPHWSPWRPRINARGEFKAMLSMSERSATDALGALVKRGLLKSDSPQGKVRFGLPLHALRFLFPRLWPEAEAEAVDS